jgi:hypothetical protein
VVVKEKFKSKVQRFPGKKYMGVWSQGEEMIA